MNKKIDIYVRTKENSKFFKYECSTIRYKNCKEAKDSFCKQEFLEKSQVKATFSK